MRRIGSLDAYIAFLTVQACVITGVSLSVQSGVSFTLPLLLLFLALTLLTEIAPVSYGSGHAQTVSTALLIALAFIAPPSAVVLVAFVGAIVPGILYRKPWRKTWFNGVFWVSLFGSVALLMQAAKITPPAATLYHLAAVSLIFMVYAALSTSLLSIVIALAQGRRIASMWRETARFFNAYDIALLPYGLVLAWLWTLGPWYFAAGLLPLAALQRSFADHAGFLNEQHRTAELVEQQRRVHEAITVLLSGKTMCEQLDTLLAHIGAVFPVERAGVVLWGEYGQPDAFATRDDVQLEQALRRWRTDLLALRGAHQMVRLDQQRPACRIDDLPLWLVPLATPSGVLGTMLLVGERTWQVSPQQQRLVETFAGQAALAISQSRLITRLQETRQQLIESERLAAVGGLAAGVAHEFNNLLSVLSGNVQVAMDEPDPHERQQLLETVVHLALNGTSITDGLLRFGRREEPRREATNLAMLVDAVLTAIRNDCKNARVSVVRDFDDVPPIVCEAGAISQVLINILFNALDAIHPNAGTLTVRIKQRDPYVAITVQDTGCGIPASILHTIFEPFMTTKAAQRNKLHGGTGLGLSVSHGIIANHGGSIEVASTEGQGSTFTLYLPISPEGASVVDAAPVVPVPAPRLRAVVVDDEPAIAQSLGRMLTRDGHTAIWFTKPEDAIAALQQEGADVVFADLRMPGMDGLALLQWVQQQDPHAERVLISAHIDQQHREQAGVQGIKAVIEKPFDFADVQRVLGTLASSS
jgi:signal transduction histidine kinase/CheY-like chemotaxis protein